MMIKNSIKVTALMALGIASWAPVVWAQNNGFGPLASNLFSTIEGISTIIHVICGAAGAALFLAAFFRYFAYRRNPVVAPLSSVITLLLTGLCLIALIFIPIGSA
jgi:hypothetical protein